jgi:DnaJ-class molecular chaperone
MKFKCPVCNGKGEKIIQSQFEKETLIYTVKCDYCNGTGFVSRGQLYTKKRKG